MSRQHEGPQPAGSGGSETIQLGGGTYKKDSAPTVLDDHAAIRRVLDADPEQLQRVLAVDPALRRALRCLPPCRETDGLRTLVAAARVEQRRRTAAAGLAGALGQVAS